MDRSPVWLYWPNIIGYARVIFAILAIHQFTRSPWIGGLFYAISEFLDAADGHVARMLNQASIFGAVLDQITDRLSTMGLYILLAAVKPSMAFFWFILSTADVGGHWIWVYCHALRGSKTHKKVESRWPGLKSYYESRPVMFTCHLCYEVALASYLVLCQMPVGSIGYYSAATLFIVSLPLAFFKATTNLAQLCLGSRELVYMEKKN